MISQLAFPKLALSDDANSGTIESPQSEAGKATPARLELFRKHHKTIDRAIKILAEEKNKHQDPCFAAAQAAERIKKLDFVVNVIPVFSCHLEVETKYKIELLNIRTPGTQ